LIELQARYKSKNGYLITEGSYGSLPYVISTENNEFIDKTVARYHIFSKGDYSKEGYYYGFNIRKSSDKSYLKNYYDMYDNYLASEVYFNKASGYDYYSTKAYHFQGLQTTDSTETDPIILPKVTTKKVIGLNEDDSLFFTLKTNTLTYNEQAGKEFGKTSITTSVTGDYITKGGHFVQLTARNRADAYLISRLPSKGIDKNITLTRLIPEAEFMWHYPLINLSKNCIFMIEPLAQTIIGQNYSAKNQKFGLIDAGAFELSENNLFSGNRYSGTDYHEFGKRLNYGVQTTIKRDSKSLGVFVGQSLNKHNAPLTRNKEIVGKVNFILDNSFELFYRFKRDELLKPIRDELGANFWLDKLKGQIGIVKLSNLEKYYFLNEASFPNNKIEQAYYKLEYHLNENWTLGNEIHFDFSKNKLDKIYDNFAVTYNKDCIGITLKLARNYTQDLQRGINKDLRGYYVALRLKSINM
jgi:LPS-assembly protein